MTYDFAYDFETLPTFGRVFDFRLLKNSPKWLTTFAGTHSLVRAGSKNGSGWWAGSGWFSLVGLLKSPEPLKIKAFRAAGGLFRSIFRFSLFRFTGLYMLFFGLVMGLKSFLAVRLNKDTPVYYTRLKSPKNSLKTQGIFSAGFRGCF